MSPETFARDFDVSRETITRLKTFSGLLESWNPRINLVSRASLADVWSRHIADSAQLLELAPTGADTWADLGAGGGFPGLVIAILAQDKRPSLRLALVESDKRKCAFLRSVLQKTDVTTTIVSERIEETPPLGAAVVSARALAPLSRLIDYATRHLAPGGTALFPKGAAWRTEVAEALETRRFRCEEIPSRTAADAVILRIGEIDRG